MPTSIPRWEAELWSYVGHGDGMHCPLHGRCLTVQNGEWCPDENRERLNRLLDARKFNLRDYDFIEAGTGKQCRLVQLLERLAIMCLQRGNFSFSPVSTELITLFDQEHTAEIRQLPLKAYHGAIWHHQNEWVIQIKDSDATPIQRGSLSSTRLSMS